MVGKSIDEMEIGQKETMIKTVSEEDIAMFGKVSGDMNPAHFDEEYAKTTRFKGRIAHGLIPLSYISAIGGMQLPGPGSLYLGQEVKFLAPVKIGDTITATIEAIELNKEKNIFKGRSYCVNQDGVIVLDGTITLYPPKKK